MAVNGKPDKTEPQIVAHRPFPVMSDSAAPAREGQELPLNPLPVTPALTPFIEPEVGRLGYDWNAPSVPFPIQTAFLTDWPYENETEPDARTILGFTEIAYGAIGHAEMHIEDKTRLLLAGRTVQPLARYRLQTTHLRVDGALGNRARRTVDPSPAITRDYDSMNGIARSIPLNCAFSPPSLA